MKLFEALTLGASLFAAIMASLILFDITDHRKATEDLPQPPSLLRDYQIEVDNDSIYLWDGTREVGSVPQGSNKFDSIILKDNQ